MKCFSSSVAAVAVTAMSCMAMSAPSFAQSKDDAIQRLEAKLDALAKENAALRDRVKRIEAAQLPKAPVRAASVGTTSNVRPAASKDAASTVLAADYAVKAPMRSNCPAQSWQGAYAGVHGGGVNYTANRTDQDAFTSTFATVVQKEWGGLLGGQIGYNWTSCNTLWGIEVDGSWASADVTTTSFPILPGIDLNVNSRFDGLVTGRARTGIVMDNLLLYLTGGVAGVHTRTIWTQNFFTPPPASLASAEIEDWRWGWVVGFGTEWKWSNRVNIRSEALYVDVPDRQNTVNIVPNVGAPFDSNFTRSDSMWIGRLGLNYRLGG